MSADMVRSIARERTARVERYVMALVVGVVVVLVVVLAGVQWFRPLPSPVFRSAVSTSLRLPGSDGGIPGRPRVQRRCRWRESEASGK